MFLKHKYVPCAFATFAVMCGIFGFVTEVWGKTIVISSSFYLQMSMVGFLAAIYFEYYRRH